MYDDSNGEILKVLSHGLKRLRIYGRMLAYSAKKLQNKQTKNVLWDNGLYPDNYILNKCRLASSQAGSIGTVIRQKIEVGQQEFW